MDKALKSVTVYNLEFLRERLWDNRYHGTFEILADNMLKIIDQLEQAEQKINELENKKCKL